MCKIKPINTTLVHGLHCMVIFLSCKIGGYSSYIGTPFIPMTNPLSHINFSSFLETTFVNIFYSGGEDLQNEGASR